MNPEDVLEIVQAPAMLASEPPSRRIPPRTGNQQFKGRMYKAPEIKKLNKETALLFAHRLRYELKMDKDAVVKSIIKQLNVSATIARSLYDQVGKKRKRH